VNASLTASEWAWIAAEMGSKSCPIAATGAAFCLQNQPFAVFQERISRKMTTGLKNQYGKLLLNGSGRRCAALIVTVTGGSAELRHSCHSSTVA
jgi:hypothetical protein